MQLSPPGRLSRRQLRSRRPLRSWSPGAPGRLARRPELAAQPAAAAPLRGRPTAFFEAGRPTQALVALSAATVAAGDVFTSAACWGGVTYTAGAAPPALTTARPAVGAPSYLAAQSGTSMATPHVAGLAAIVRQYCAAGWHPGAGGGGPAPANAFSPAAALLRAVLVNSGAPLAASALAALRCSPPSTPQPTPTPAPAARLRCRCRAPRPASASSTCCEASRCRHRRWAAWARAWRRCCPASRWPPAPLPLPDGFQPPPDNAPARGVDPAMPDGGAAVYCVAVAAGSSLLSAALVWTDPPAALGAASPLVNNLDLELLPPNGSDAATLRGNADPADGFPQAADAANSVEKIEVANLNATLAAPGGARLAPPYRLAVRGAAVLLGPQPYALVATGTGTSLAPAGSCGGDVASPTSSASQTGSVSPSPSRSASRSASPSSSAPPSVSPSASPSPTTLPPARPPTSPAVPTPPRPRWRPLQPQPRPAAAASSGQVDESPADASRGCGAEAKAATAAAGGGWGWGGGGAKRRRYYSTAAEAEAEAGLLLQPLTLLSKHALPLN
jgi:hypothetical protein